MRMITLYNTNNCAEPHSPGVPEDIPARTATPRSGRGTGNAALALIFDSLPSALHK